MNEPILGKREPRVDDYKPIIWSAFLKLREAAQLTSNDSGYPVYLVGSALYKELPRDIDVSVIIPLDKYEELFGKLPEKQEYYSAYLGKVTHLAFKFTHHLYHCIDYNLDIKVCPDIWWPDKPKMLLAEPKETGIIYKKVELWYMSCETGCDCCSHKNFDQGFYIFEEEANRIADMYRNGNSNPLTGCKEKFGIYNVHKCEAEILPSGGMIVNGTNAFDHVGYIGEIILTKFK